MRFSAVIGFMLPVSALAAPSLFGRQSALDDARNQVVDGLVGTASALNTTLSQATAIQDPPQQAVIDDTIKAQGDLALASAAVESIGAAIQAGVAPQESDQLAVAQGILAAQSTIGQLEGEINNDLSGVKDRRDRRGGRGKGRGKKNRISSEELTTQLNDLRASIAQARDSIALALSGGVSVLEQQGKSIRQLFEDAGLAVPPGF